jgi:DnaJ-domain-containing protein 1
MSFFDRILRIARAEALHRARQLGHSSPGAPDDWPPEPEEHERIHLDGPGFTRDILGPHYSALELSPDASLTDVKTAWRTAMKKYHPDLHGANLKKREAATELTRRLTNSYRILRAHLEQKAD